MITLQGLLLSTTALGGAIFLSGAAHAQSPASTGPATPAPAEASSVGGDVEAVVVVGSRIRRDTFNSPSPVVVITREETTMAGFNSTTEALQSTGITTGASQVNNAFGGFVTDGGPGANTISLRGLGAGRTLVLINGRRVAPSGTRGAVGSADLNVLPNAIIDRVEVLRDGASSVYGSDAIAGVVNVVTMTNLQGLTLEAQYNRPFDEGGEEYRISAVGGLSGERWKLGGSVEYYERGNLTLGERDWTQCNTDKLIDRQTLLPRDFIDPRTGKPKCYPITLTGSNGVTINTIGTSTLAGVGAPGSVGTSFNRFRPNSAVTAGVVGFEGVGGGGNSLNVRDTFDPRTLKRSLISPAQIYTGFAQASYELRALGNAKVYTELLATQRRSQQVGFRQLSLDYRLGSPLIPTNLAASNFAADQGTSGGQRVGVRAFIGFGNDRSSQDVEFYKANLGLRGEFTLLPEWRYDLTVTHADSDATYAQQSFLTNRVTFASDAVVAPAGTDATLVRNGLTCRINITNPAERCVPFPPLNSQTISGQLPADFTSYIFRPVQGRTRYKETVFSANFDGPIFELPAGQVQAVIGAEYRRLNINDQPDPNSVAGNLYNLTSAAPTIGRDNVKELYAELEVPLLADMPFADNLTVSGSVRYTDYQSYGDDVTYKIGAVFSPVKWASLRVTKGTSFRAPALFEQFQGATSGFLSSAGDPCNNYGVLPGGARRTNCAAELPGNPTFLATTGIRVFSEGGAAAGLKAETSDNLTIGVILQSSPGAFGEFAFAVDYFDIQIDNGVDQAGGSNILQRCYDDPQFRAGGGFCRLVTRNSATNGLTVSNAYTNIATQVVKGFDYSLRWEREIGPGSLRFNANVTQYKDQASNLFPGEPLEQFNGTIGAPKWTGTFDLTYTMDNWRFRYGMEWIDAMDSFDYLEENPATSQFDFRTDNYYLHQVSVRYTSDNDWRVTAGVRNLLDAKPPTISAGFYNRIGNAALYSGFDYVGRRAFVNVTKTF